MPFYQNAFTTDAATRISNAMSDASSDLIRDNLDIERLNPSGEAFRDFGLRDGLTIRVTYDDPIKVPLMQFAFKSVMCGDDTGN